MGLLHPLDHRRQPLKRGDDVIAVGLLVDREPDRRDLAWRLGLADGERQYDVLEQRLAAAPTISVPTITLEGDANGAPHPGPDTYARKFAGPYEHRLISGGIGHNLPQEAPQAFAQAVIDVARR